MRITYPQTEFSIGKNENIYSSVPEEQFTEFGDTEALIIYLQSTKGKFTPAKILAKECGYNTNSSCPELRKDITILIEEKGLPIIANSTGFAWAESSSQITFYIKQLESRKMGLQRRIDCLTKIADSHDFSL